MSRSDLWPGSSQCHGRQLLDEGKLERTGIISVMNVGRDCGYL